MSPVTVVTGANSGIGRATAVQLAKQGHTVFGTLRSLAKAEKLNAMAKQAGVAVELVVMDVADDESVRRGFAEIQARYPELGMFSDYDAAQSGRTRRQVLERFCDSPTVLCTAHFPSPSLGRVARWEDGFRFVAAD